MNSRKLRARSTEDLKEKMADAEKELMKLNAQSAQAVIKKPSQIKELKKTIAKINTLMREKTQEELQKNKEKK
ncbi:50S ribosomal protein L29 [Candidatus Woesearchaeota archaeon]|nr:50S ribosomal protein L29 [Candidatus Woesearchaeota archaeon]